MTEHHGENPMETETEWSTVNNSRSKRDNQEPIAKTMNEKSTTNKTVEVEIETIRALPPKHEKTVLTLINFMILPSKGITTISIPHSMNRLIQVIQTVDPKACLTVFSLFLGLINCLNPLVTAPHVTLHSVYTNTNTYNTY
jgi:hypothetical protein